MSHSSDRTWPPYRDDYPFAMSGAHRKPAYQIGCPSISWHAGFWRSSTSDVRSTNWYQGESRREGDQWILCIEQQILNIYKNLKEQKRRKDLRNVWRKPSVTNLQHIKSPGPDEVYLLRNKYRERSDGDFERINQLPGALGLGRGDLNARYETAHVFGVWDSLPLDIRFEVTSEFYTITTTIDFSRLAEAPNMPIDRRRRNPGEFDEKFEIYKKLREAMCAVIRATNERRRSRKIKKVGGRAHRDVIFTEKARFLYFDIWKELRADVFKADVAKNYVSGLGECFANFTNLSLQTLDGENVRDPWSCNDSIPARQFNNNHDFSKELPFTSSIVGHIFQDSKDGGDDIAWVDALHPILLAIEPKEAASLPADSVEYTYTKFCNERCIYGSGFGPQIDDDDQIGQPLTYLLLFGFDEHHQIGRLLQRLHTLGCMRLAAIFDLRVIKNQFDYDLDDIEVATSNLEDELANLWNQTYEVYSDKETPFRTTLVWRRRENNKIADLLGKIHESLRKLGSVGAGVSPDPRQSYSVPMRAWRSTFYRERFDALIRALNSKFIEGYQPYGRFTEHRLIRAHHTIKFVAEHYRQLKEKEIRLRREWMALRSEHHQRDIADAQSLAELLFFVFLLPHYATDWPPIELFHNGINKLAGFSIDVHWVTLVVSVLLFAVFRYPQLRRSVGVIWKGPIVLWRAFGEIPQKWKDFDQNKPT